MKTQNQRLLAVVSAVALCLVSFNLLKPEQAAAVVTVISALFAYWMPNKEESEDQ